MTERLLQDSLLSAAEHAPDREAVVADGRRMTYGELADSALRLATGLQGLGVRRGDRVLVYMDNSIPAATAIFAVLLAGGVFVVVNPQTKEDKLRFLLEDSGAAVLIADGNLRKVRPEALDGVPAQIVAAGPSRFESAVSLDEVMGSSPPAPTPAGTIPLDLAALIYTSGTTGEPKGVMQTHQSMVFARDSVAEYLRVDESERILAFLPLAVSYGLHQLLLAVGLAATLILERSFAYPRDVLRRLEEERATVFPAVPTAWATLLGLENVDQLSYPSVTRVTNAGAALPDSFVDGLRGLFPNALIFPMYGQTECKRVCYLEPELVGKKPGSVGKAIPGTETLVLDSSGSPVAPGETGILHVRGAHVMAGYWGRSDLTAMVLKDGPLPGERMLCTNDQFTVDDEGFLYFAGRSDDIIKSRGEKVSPVEVENVLYAIAGLREAAVIGVDDPVLGEAIRAYVTVDDGAGLTEDAILRECRSRLESFMVPEQVVILDALPKTQTGKISKTMLREQAVTP